MRPPLTSSIEPESRHCTVCRSEIPAIRIAAIPEATMCVGCVRDSGDPHIHRFDDYYGTEAEHVAQIFYFPGDPYIEAAKRRLAKFGEVKPDYGFDSDPRGDTEVVASVELKAVGNDDDVSHIMPLPINVPLGPYAVEAAAA